MPNEVVLIAAHKNVAQRFGIRLHFHAQRLRHFARLIAQVRFGQSLDRQHLERQLIGRNISTFTSATIDFCRHRWMRRKIF